MISFSHGQLIFAAIVCIAILMIFIGICRVYIKKMKILEAHIDTLQEELVSVRNHEHALRMILREETERSGSLEDLLGAGIGLHAEKI